MNVISHRGYWKNPDEKNGRVAFGRSFDLGFGTETDLRDLAGELVVSHDMPSGSEMTLVDLLEILDGRDLPLAINIKADGLAKALKERMKAQHLTQWFTFDMSTPELVTQLRLGLPAYSRASEYENPPVCYSEVKGIWLDAFESQWYAVEDVAAFLQDGKTVCIVSPELHQRDPLPLWTTLKTSKLRAHPNLTLCTDLPEKAVEWFGEKR